MDIGQLDLTETNKVGLSLVKASELLAQRAAERERAESVRRQAEELERSNAELQRREADAQAHTSELSAIITDLQRAEAALRASEKRWSTTLHSIGDAVLTTDTSSRITFLNPVAEALTGWESEEALGQPIQSVFPIINKQTRVPAEDIVAHVLKEGHVVELANHTALIARDGHEIPIEDSAAPILDSTGKMLGVVLVFHDVTEKRHKNEQLQRLNRTLNALNNSNQALLRATEESALLEKVCKIVTEDCGHAMVWIGYAEDNEAKTVKPVAYSGFEEGYLETLALTWADTERGRGPTGTTIRTGQPCWCRDMLTDPKFKPWRAEAIKRGYASSLVLPLMEDGKAFGAITIYSRQSDAFSEDEVKLLLELTGDLAYGINTLRLRAAHELVEEELHISQERVTAIIDSAMDAVITISADQHILVFNKAAESIFGCPAAEAIGLPLDCFIPAAFREAHRRHIQAFASTGKSSRSMHSPAILSGLRANGEEFPLEATISQMTGGRRKAVHDHPAGHHRTQAGRASAPPQRETGLRGPHGSNHRARDQQPAGGGDEPAVPRQGESRICLNQRASTWRSRTRS